MLSFRTAKRSIATLLSTLITGCFAIADAPESTAGPYIGLFGGLGYSSSSSLRQEGAVLTPPPHSLPILPIDARGPTNSTSDIPVGGLQIGYEWDQREIGQDWAFAPAVEIEGMYMGEHTPLGDMPVHPAFLGTQYVTFPMTTSLLMANAVFTIHTPYSDKILPYFGLGAGLAYVSVEGSDSANPSEPGINHFNSDPDASDTALAWQAKVGIKSEIYKNLFLFVEYRYLSIDSTSYTFGATDYPGVHPPTDIWDVNLARQEYNLFVTGLQYKF